MPTLVWRQIWLETIQLPYPVRPNLFKKREPIKVSALLVLSLCPLLAWTQLRLPNVLGDHMVLQRNNSVNLWGWGNAGETIDITTSWDQHTYSTTVDQNGHWSQAVATPDAGGPYEVRFEGSRNITLRDIMIGEVWLASGQSNMEWSANHGIDNAEQAVAEATESQLRFFEISKTTAVYPQDNCSGTWQVCSPKTMQDFSAVAYFFGRHLTEELEGIPIGLIQSAWGGTPAEVWTPKAVIDENPSFHNWQILGDRPGWPREPARCYNAMIYPIRHYKIAGVIWYQGESNVANSTVYANLFPAMIESWRDTWQSPLPFYFVQIAPYNYGAPFSAALQREAQRHTLSTPMTGMVVCSDIGDYYDIHPRNKLDVGIRLANLALNRNYGKSRTDSGPLYRDHIIEGSAIRVQFDHADGLTFRENTQTDVLIAGEDQLFFPAEASVDGNDLLLSSELVPDPVAVRFAFNNMTNPGLVNGAGLPASSFRTDQWDILVKPVNIEVHYRPAAEAYEVSMDAGDDVAQIRYTTNGDHPGFVGLAYTRPFYIDKDCTIRAIAVTANGNSDLVTEKQIVLTTSSFRQLTYETQNYSSQYTGGGLQALVDAHEGTLAHRDGRWQGYQGNSDLSLVIDLGQRESISSISIRALKNQGANIFLPRRVAFAVSNDGERFQEVFRKPGFHSQDDEVRIETYYFSLRRDRKSRYIKITAENLGEVPGWHRNAGAQAWMMFDEISVN